MNRYPLLSTSHSSNQKNIDAYQQKIIDIEKRVNRGEKVYVAFNNNSDARRTGSIGYLKTFSLYNESNSWYSLRHGVNRTNSPHYRVDRFSVGWDGKRNSYEPYVLEIDILEDYQGPTVWKWEKPKIDPVKAYDRTGVEITKGQFISYVLHQYEGKGSSLHFGNVTKVEDDGTVWAKNITLDSKEKSADKKIKHNDNVVVLTKDILDRLMMLKLASR